MRIDYDFEWAHTAPKAQLVYWVKNVAKANSAFDQFLGAIVSERLTEIRK